jgi:hypothetical protein
MSIAAHEPEYHDQASIYGEPLAQDCFLSTRQGGWDSCLEQLFVVHQNGSIVLFTCHFQENIISVNSGEFDDLYGSAISMMDALLGEIVASKGHIKEITLDNEVLSYAFGKHCCFILFTACYLDEMKSRLDKFAVDFETRFAAKLAGNFIHDINEYEQALSLVEEHFSKRGDENT